MEMGQHGAALKVNVFSLQDIWGGSIHGGTTIAGWFIEKIHENPMKMDDLGVPPHLWKPPSIDQAL